MRYEVIITVPVTAATEGEAIEAAAEFLLRGPRDDFMREVRTDVRIIEAL